MSITGFASSSVPFVYFCVVGVSRSAPEFAYADPYEFTKNSHKRDKVRATGRPRAPENTRVSRLRDNGASFLVYSLLDSIASIVSPASNIATNG
jgi:hypothetical protein